MKKRKKILFVVFLLLFVLLVACTHFYHLLPYSAIEFTERIDCTDQFSQEAVCDRTGWVYHYIKSDIKGNDRADVWVYYPDMYHSESFKIYKFAKLQKATDLVCATYSEQTFQPTSIEAYLVSKDGERKLNAKMEMSDKSFTVSRGNRSFEEKIGVIPSYNINFDWVDMNSMLPFRLDSEKPFKFGFVTLNSFGQMHYSGLINCEYIGEEIYNGIRCHAYSILSEEYSSKKGRFLTECGTEDLVLIETEHSGNPLYKNFKFELIEKYVIGSKYEWDDFIMIWCKKR